MIPIGRYRQIIEVLPILCVDVIVMNTAGQYLLIKRRNEPKKDKWWVIGGRVRKGESLEEAALRKVREEVSLNVHDLNAIGYYEGVYSKNIFFSGKNLHTVSVVFSAIIADENGKVKLMIYS